VFSSTVQIEARSKKDTSAYTSNSTVYLEICIELCSSNRQPDNANDKITALQEYDPSLLHILSDDVLSKIKANAQSWEDDVPYEVVKAIKFFELFGYQQKVEKH
jgi:hypothetical protein